MLTTPQIVGPVAILVVAVALVYRAAARVSKTPSKGRTMKLLAALIKALSVMMPAAMLAGCGISRPGNVDSLRRMVGLYLIGAWRATDADQQKIDRTVVRLRAGGACKPVECNRLSTAE